MDESLLVASRIVIGTAAIGGALVALITSVRRGRRAWLSPAAAVMLLVGFALGLVAPGPPNGVVADLAAALWFIGFPLLASTFPDGRFVPRWSIGLVAASVVVFIVDSAVGGDRSSTWWTAFAAVQLVLGLGFIAYRYRRSATTAERESVRWALLGLLASVTCFVVVAFVHGGRIGDAGPLSEAAANAASLPIILGVVIGLVRPRVWNVDAAFRAFLVVVGVAAVLGLLFAGVIAAATALGAEFSAAAWWGAAALAAAGHTITRVCAFAANWLVFRGRLAPHQAAARLAAVLDADDPRSTAQRVAIVAAEATASPSVTVRAADPADAAVFDAHCGVPIPTSEASVEEVPIALGGELLAALAVAPRNGESSLSARDRSGLATIARLAAPALHGARALREATAAQAELVRAREEERRELRRELHDDLGPWLTGLVLSAAALARRADPLDPVLGDTARELQHDIQQAAERARDISHGLRPPVLDDHGIEAAIRDRLRTAPGTVPEVRLEIEHVGELPAAVDLAVLRIVQESVANVRSHADARSCTVRVGLAEGGVRVEVLDDGIGVPEQLRPGLGLRSIRERADELGGTARVERGLRGGTVVSVWLPVEREVVP